MTKVNFIVLLSLLFSGCGTVAVRSTYEIAQVHCHWWEPCDLVNSYGRRVKYVPVEVPQEKIKCMGPCNVDFKKSTIDAGKVVDLSGLKLPDYRSN